MKSKVSPFLFTSILIALATSCKKDPIHVELMKFQNQVALFTVENNSGKDIYTVTFEVTLFSKDKTVLKVDTVDFSNISDAEGNLRPFVEAGKDTFFPYGITEETASTTARAIEFSFEK